MCENAWVQVPSTAKRGGDKLSMKKICTCTSLMSICILLVNLNLVLHIFDEYLYSICELEFGLYIQKKANDTDECMQYWK